MNDRSSLRERLRLETGVVRGAHADVEAEVRRRRGEPLAPGDLCVLEQTADLPVEWAILDRDAERAVERLLVVPADTNSLVGSADVAVPAGEPRGALTLRCRYGAWRSAEVFASHQRTGFLTPAFVQRARRLWTDVGAGALSGSLAQGEVDRESEYLDWQREVLGPACAAIEKDQATRKAASNNVVEFKKPTKRSQRWTRASSTLGLAASILFVVSLGLWREVGLLGELQRSVAEEHRLEVALLQEKQESLEANHRSEIERLRVAQELAASEPVRQTEEPVSVQTPQPHQPLVNVPFAVLSTARTRSVMEPLELHADASLALLILQLGTGPSYTAYRLEMVRAGTELPLWIGEDLKTRGAELTIALPKSYLRTGDYELRLFGVHGEQSERLDEYHLKVLVE